MSNLSTLQTPDATVTTVASNIAAEVARARMDDKDLAAVIGLTPMSVSRRLNGKTAFTTSEVAKIAAFFGVSIGDLFTSHAKPRGGAGLGAIRHLYLMDSTSPTGVPDGEVTAVEPLAPVIDITGARERRAAATAS